jgi:hypothetical protein
MLMLDRLLQSRNAASPISLTPLGMLIDLSAEQPSKAWLPMLVALPGMLTLLSDLQL